MKASKQKELPSMCLARHAWFFIGVFALYTSVPIASAATLPDGEAKLLEPERAFQLSARYKDSKNLTLEYKIAQGYYLYRARFKFTVAPTTSVKLGAARFPQGNIQQDSTFGRVETYRDSVRILLPITSLGKNVNSQYAQPFRIQVTSQGCADEGVCFPPQQQYVTLRPGKFDVVLPDGAMNVSNGENLLQSRPQVPSKSISEALRKQSKL